MSHIRLRGTKKRVAPDTGYTNHCLVEIVISVDSIRSIEHGLNKKVNDASKIFC